MKANLMIAAMVGLLCLFFLSSITEAAPGGLPECTNSLNTCTTNLGACTNNLNICTTNLGACTTGLAQAQTNIATCEANAQASLLTCQANLAASQANLATCQENTLQCGQTAPPPSWYQKVPCDSTSNCPRFEVLADWNNEAVLDKETGLVWEQSPSSDGTFHWGYAQFYCTGLTKGNRKGWRVPAIQELASLVDPTMTHPALPSGHPFTNVQEITFRFYWSATTNTSNAYTLYSSNGNITSYNISGDVGYIWCVRGGQAANYP